jgi:hypothetical protein
MMNIMGVQPVMAAMRAQAAQRCAVFSEATARPGAAHSTLLNSPRFKAVASAFLHDQDPEPAEQLGGNSTANWFGGSHARYSCIRALPLQFVKREPGAGHS